MCCLAMSATTLLTREHHHHHHHPTPPTSHCATNRAIAAASALDAPDNIPCAYLAPLPPHSAPFAVQLLSDSQFNKIRANHHPNTLLLPPTLSALLSQPQNSSVPSTEFRIVPSADIPRIHSLTLSYVNSPTLLYTLPQPWIRDLLMDAVIYPDLLNRPHIWYALDGSPLSFSITRMRFFDDPADTGGAPEFLQIHLGRVTTDTRFILPPMTRASFFSDALPHTRIPLDAFGTAGARVADLFRIFKLPSFKILYGALLTGPTGSGKSSLLNELCLSNAIQPTLISLARLLAIPNECHDAEIKLILDEAFSTDRCFIILDKIEVLFPKKLPTVQASDLSAMYLTLHQTLDHLRFLANERKKGIMIIGVTSYPDRANMAAVSEFFAEKIHQPKLTPTSRAAVLETLFPSLSRDRVVKAAKESCTGFLLADLFALRDHAAETDLEGAIAAVARRVRGAGDFGVAVEESGRVEFEDVGGLEDVKAFLVESLFWFHSRTDDFRKLGITPSKGVLLYGPPGTGKTLLAKAVATEAKVNFLSISISAIVKGHVGESEKQISNIFQQAKAASPSIVFLDEIESVFASRESSGDYSQKILAQLVQEIDALSLGSFEAGSADGEPAKVVVLAATNFPALIDPTLLRPGRIDRLIAVRLPTRAQRESILQVYARKNNTASDISWPEWSRKIPGWSGAAIAELFRKARVVAIGADSGESQNLTPVILEKHLHAAWTDLMSSHDSFIPSETAI